ncbi:hypothetical protein PanWU01x14_285380 [Parasponia andersonii]|uniref:Uncharacterized protein n=1 Tax=Parasponia andersonii TaxID=3476 RepID=A0A2P5AZT8_PARAD|nr:hypothetical protein PanWU01x14_285380 [Parasponia andersonii]
MEDKRTTQTTMSGPRRGGIALVSRQKAPTWNPLWPLFPAKTPTFLAYPEGEDDTCPSTRQVSSSCWGPDDGGVKLDMTDTNDVAAVIPFYCYFNLTAQQRRERA